MSSDTEDDTAPLLLPSSRQSPFGSISKVLRKSSSENESQSNGSNTQPSRSVEDDVLPETSPLGRTLSWHSAFIIVISRVIGSGIFAAPGAIVKSVGSPGLSLLLWVVGAVVAACGLSVALEYGSMLPRSGGDKVYLEFTYRRPKFLASTLIAVQAVLLGFTASNCVIFSQYVFFAAGVDNPSDLARKSLAVSLLSVITLIHGCFPKFGVRLQNFLGWVKVGIITFMLLSGVYVVVFRDTGKARATHTLPEWEDLWEGSNWNWGIISTSLFKVYVSYAGLDNANNVLNEVKDPIRTLRSVTSTALIGACVLYLLTNVAYFIVVPVDEIKGSGEMIAALFFERTFGQHLGRKILPLAIALSAAGNVMVVAFTFVRLTSQQLTSLTIEMHS
jgi:amino acid transporter